MNTEFQLMVQDFVDIAAVVELFPENLQEQVYSELMKVRHKPDIGGGDLRDPALGLGHDSVSTREEDIAGEITNEVEGTEDFYRRCSILAYNDMQASAIVAYYYTEVAPKDDFPMIGYKEYLEMCELTERRLPADANGTLNNAQYKGYLIPEGRRRYSLSDEGRTFVEREVLGMDR